VLPTESVSETSLAIEDLTKQRRAAPFQSRTVIGEAPSMAMPVLLR